MCVVGTGGARIKKEWVSESRSERNERGKVRDRREGELEDHG